jgi:predicted permease
MATASAAAILFGLLPALRASRRGLAGSGMRVTAGSFSGRTLVAGQLALSLVLLIGAGLFLATIRNLKATDLGFRPESVVGFDVSFRRGTTGDEVRQAYMRIRENLKGSAGVENVSFVWPSVYSRGLGWRRGVTVEGRALPAGRRDFACGVSVGPEFFETTRVGLLAGRLLDERDQYSATPAMVVNESFASAYLTGGPRIGRHVVVDGAPSKTWEIVGIVRDAKHYGVREKVCSTTYVPAGQAPASNAYASQGFGSFLLRTGAGTTAIGARVRAAVSAAGGGAQIEDIQPLEAIVDDMIGEEYMITVLATALAILALVLAAIGLFGVTAYSVSRRTGELGIRMALGAAPADVRGLVLTETTQLVAIGIGCGLAAALLLTSFAKNLLYGVRPTDQLIFAASATLLATVAAVAAYLPARRASQIDPMTALRHE